MNGVKNFPAATDGDLEEFGKPRLAMALNRDKVFNKFTHDCSLGSGCSTVVERMPHQPEVMGSNPCQELGFFICHEILLHHCFLFPVIIIITIIYQCVTMSEINPKRGRHRLNKTKIVVTDL